MKEKVILCYGDSLTWGQVPGGENRYSYRERWTGIMAAELGDLYRVVEEGVGGRTTVYDSPGYDYRNGLRGLKYALNAQKPLDMVIVMLGTNDLKVTDVYGAARGIQILVQTMKNANAIYPSPCLIFNNSPKILMVAPPPFHRDINTRELLTSGSAVRNGLYGKYEDSILFAQEYAKVAKIENVDYLDASLYAEGDVMDCVHINREANQKLGVAMAEKVRSIFEVDV